MQTQISRGAQTGFTLIELMIVVAIVGILSSIATSFVQTYAIRAKVTEGVVIAAAAKVAVSEYVAMYGELPPSNGQETFEGFVQDVQSPYVESLDWHVGQRIEIEFDEDALGIDGEIEIGLEPVIVGGVVNWRCGQDQMSERNLKYVPSNCRERLFDQ
ncbi:MAG: pilin [Pseudomonadota bacterium]